MTIESIPQDEICDLCLSVEHCQVKWGVFHVVLHVAFRSFFQEEGHTVLVAIHAGSVQREVVKLVLELNKKTLDKCSNISYRMTFWSYPD